MKVLKFGGTSVASAKNIKLVRDIVAARAKKEQLLVVVSAFSQVTNKLQSIVDNAVSDNPASLKMLDKIKKQHHKVTDELLNKRESERVKSSLDETLKEIRKIIQGVGIIGEMTPRVNDRIMSLGERLSSQIISAYFNESLERLM